jgi:ribokinase
MSGSIVVVGSLNMDLVVRTPRLPKPGETILGSDFRTFPGGKGANQAVAAARLGGAVQMIGRVGSDPFGETLLETIGRGGVSTAYVQKDPQAATGVAFITVDTNGQNSIVVASGANAKLTPEDIYAAEQAFKGAAVLLLQLESPIHAVTHAIELACKHGVKVLLNPAPAQLLDIDILSSVDYLVPNQTELALLTGVESIPEAVGILEARGIRRVIVTLGGDGVLVVEDGKEVNLPAHRVQVVDTTAAGDAFVGAFAVGLTEGHSTLTAAAWGNAAGALAVTKAGAQPSLPTRSEFEKFLSESTTETD